MVMPFSRFLSLIHIYHPLDLLLPADDVVQLAVPGLGGQIGAEVLDVLALLLVEALLFLLDPGAAKAAVFPGAAAQHLVHRKGGGAPGGEQLVAAVVVVQVHQLGHLLGGRFQLLVGCLLYTSASTTMRRQIFSETFTLW